MLWPELSQKVGFAEMAALAQTKSKSCLSLAEQAILAELTASLSEAVFLR